MDRRNGFTLIELLITISILTILLAITVFTLRGNQATVRDEKRTTDIAVIAQQLEQYYQSGSNGASHTAGRYPPTVFMNSETTIKNTLRDLDLKTLRAPGVEATSPISLNVAANAAQQTPSVSQYIYQPLTSTGALCSLSTDECRKFTIYYQLENNPTVQMVVSKNQ